WTERIPKILSRRTVELRLRPVITVRRKMPSWRIRTAEDSSPLGTPLVARQRLIDYWRWLDLLVWLDADEAAMAALVGELHIAGDKREERVVLALANVFASLVPRT